MPLELVTIPCLSDNYAYLLHDGASGATALVDAPEAGPIAAELARRGWRLSDILITHHHDDHVAGVAALRSGARVIGAAADAQRLPPLDLAVAPGDRITVCGEEVGVIDAAGHTVGHVAYHFPRTGAVMTGDSLMALGCGRLFEGTAAQMWATLSRLATLPPATLICSGHEYAEANGRFAATVDAGNPALAERRQTIAGRRARGLPTVPVALGLEAQTNPFLRAADPGMKAALGMAGAGDEAVFAELRSRKDRF
jgi:hydroxyacylglutathione hydrolase